jgi:hypothetical protein
MGGRRGRRRRGKRGEERGREGKRGEERGGGQFTVLHIKYSTAQHTAY